VSDIDRVIGQHEGPSRTVLEYGQTVEKLVKAAKEPGFGPDGWAPLAALVATNDFVRVGNFKEVMDWQQYTSFLGNWAASAEWDCSFKRITEANGVVFLELEERSAVGDFRSVVNSMSAYEFNGDGRIRRIDVYLQMELPNPELLQSYGGVEIST
jgi:hypothetical protein